jgi:threonine/homoserine/homoserine lactone efflux protein
MSGLALWQLHFQSTDRLRSERGMDIPLLLRGVIIGFGIAAPVGPIGLLCIQRTLRDGRLAGLASGLGAATADALYGFVAAFGLTLVTAFLVEQRMWLGLLGGLFLLYLGWRTFISAPAGEAAAAGGQRGLLGAYGSTLALTLTNPMTILSFVAIFAGAGLATGRTGGEAALLAAGIFAGSAAWWLLLSGGVSLARTRIDGRALRWVNRAAGAIILGFGVFALATALG